MKVVISPAKNIKPNKNNFIELSEPFFKKEVDTLVNDLKRKDIFEIEKLFKVNEKIAINAIYNYQNFNLSKAKSAALFSYDGLLYKHLKANTFNKKDCLFANEKIYILSPLFGALKAFDKVLPYRMELNSPYKINGKNILNFWDSKVKDYIFEDDKDVLALCSNEYISLLKPFLSDSDNLIECIFLTRLKGIEKSIATKCKIARGSMANFIVKNKINNINDLKNFSDNNFKFVKERSTSKRLVFVDF